MRAGPTSLILLLLVLLAAGCGSSPARYSRQAAESCLQEKGYETQQLANVPAASTLAAIAPQSFGVLVRGDLTILLFANDGKRLEGRTRDALKTPSPLELERRGNVVLVRAPNPTSGSRAIVDGCLDQARQT